MPEQQLISKYFAGTCTEAEEKIVLEYFASGEAAALEAHMQQSWETLPGDDIGDVITQRMLKQIEKATYDKPLKWWQHWQRIAAAAILLITMGSAFWLLNRRKAPVTGMAAVWETVSNEQQTSRLFVLADSTRIWLSPRSTLSYTRFTGHEKERSIKLEGEAFFDVAKDEQHPFVIYTGPIATRVLGTSFNIEAYRHEHAVRVSLVRGAVAIANADSVGAISTPMATLRPGEMLQYDKHNQHYATAKIRITNPDEWINGSLVFNEVPLMEAVHRVASRNGLTLRYAKGVEAMLQNRRLTAVFREESYTEIINNILFVSNCYIRQHGHELVIHTSK